MTLYKWKVTKTLRDNIASFTKDNRKIVSWIVAPTAKKAKQLACQDVPSDMHGDVYSVSVESIGSIYINHSPSWNKTEKPTELGIYIIQDQYQDIYSVCAEALASSSAERRGDE